MALLLPRITSYTQQQYWILIMEDLDGSRAPWSLVGRDRVQIGHKYGYAVAGQRGIYSDPVSLRKRVLRAERIHVMLCASCMMVLIPGAIGQVITCP